MKKLISLVCSAFFIANLFAQYAVPLRIPLLLSANFTEFRPNHFHSGLDFKTGGGVNLPVYSVERGYISRILVSPSGYGLALYIDHPDGRTTVYGHLNRFSSSIQDYVRQKQYELESYKVDLQVPVGLITVQRGEQIAYSGDTGNSGGPHLHFEIRDTRTENLINPLPFYKNQIQDHKVPEIQALMVYPMPSKGVVNGSSTPLRVKIPSREEVNVWGTIGLGLKATDRMDGTWNSYGVTCVKLELDGKEIYNYVNTSYSFLMGRMFNSVIDYARWRQSNEFFLKSYIEPGNTFPFYKAINNGYVQVNEEREYHFRYVVEDVHGNHSEYSFTLHGKKQDIPAQAKSPNFFAWNEDNRFGSDDFSLTIPKGNLYDSFYFTFAEKPSPIYYSAICKVNDTYIPLHGYCDMNIKVANDTLCNKSQYGVIQIGSRSRAWLGGKYENGFIRVGVRDLGDQFAVTSDSKAPVIVPLQPALWTSRAVIRLQIADNLSGVQLVRGTIDGKFALFESDVKSPVYTYRFDAARIGKGKNHELCVVASDPCGNTSEYDYKFFY